MSNIRLLRVLTADGNPTGERLTEANIHEDDHWHSCVCVCVTDGRGNIYQQHRGYNTKIAPGRYDMFLASDHIVDTDRAPQEAVERALLWRVGLRLPVDILQTMRSVYETTSEYWVPDNTYPARNGGYQGYWHRAFEYIYVVKVPGLMTDIPLKFQEGRVQGVRLCSMNQTYNEYRMPLGFAVYDRYMHRPPYEQNILEAVYEAVMALRDI